jgi:hypothetical protein
VATGETHAARPVGDRWSVALRNQRPAAAALLLLIVVAGVGAATPAVTARGPWHGHAVGIGVSLEVVLAGLEIALFIMNRRAPAAAGPATALRQALSRIIAVVMALIVVIVLANFVGTRQGSLLQRLLTAGQHSRPRKAVKAARAVHTPAAAHLAYLSYGLIAVVALVALLWFVVILVRARTRVRLRGGYVEDLSLDEPAELRQAVDSGRAALRAVDEARAAIIACYVAMEGSLAAAGTSRRLAETPDELLARAAAAGVIRSVAASRLTGLFYEARFSSHPLGPAAKDAASQALDAIAAELTSGNARSQAGPVPGTAVL